MGRPLRLDGDERRAIAAGALDALERLTEVRASGDVHRPADRSLLELARTTPPQEPADPADILDRYVRFAAAGWDKSADGVFAYIPNGALDAGPIAALLAAGAHTFTGTSFEAPAMVAMEEGVLRWMADLLGLPSGAGGLLLSGGSLANQTAIVTARARATGGGKQADDVLTMYVSEHVHHSVTKAASLVGLSSRAVRTVATDDRGRIEAEALRQVVEADEIGRAHV